LYIFLYRNIMQLLGHMCKILGDVQRLYDWTGMRYWLAVGTSDFILRKIK